MNPALRFWWEWERPGSALPLSVTGRGVLPYASTLLALRMVFAQGGSKAQIYSGALARKIPHAGDALPLTVLADRFTPVVKSRKTALISPEQSTKVSRVYAPVKWAGASLPTPTP